MNTVLLMDCFVVFFSKFELIDVHYYKHKLAVQLDEYVSAVNVFLAQETTLFPIEIQMYTGQVHSMDLFPSFSFKFSWLPIIIVCCFKVKLFFFLHLH